MMRNHKEYGKPFNDKRFVFGNQSCDLGLNVIHTPNK
jgi:hypothetical protein